MRGTTRHHDQIALFYHHLLAAGRRFCPPFAGRDLVWGVERAAKHQCRRAFENVVDVIRPVVDLDIIIYPFFVMKDRDPHLCTCCGSDIFIRVAGLLFESLLDVLNLLLCLNDKWTGCRRRLTRLGRYRDGPRRD